MKPPSRAEVESRQGSAGSAGGRVAANIQDRYMVTRHEIQQRLAATGKTITIPQGTPCKPIRNSPGPLRYRVDPWPGISKAELAVLHTQGLQVAREDVENSRAGI
jgi:hypothetical protein